MKRKTKGSDMPTHVHRGGQILAENLVLSPPEVSKRFMKGAILGNAILKSTFYSTWNELSFQINLVILPIGLYMHNFSHNSWKSVKLHS